MSYIQLATSTNADDGETENVVKKNTVLKQLKTYSTIFAHIYTIASFIWIIVLITMPGWQTPTSNRPPSLYHKALKSSEVATIDVQYGRDERYMTLDHEYDYLWSRWGERANILVFNESNKREKVPAAISMYHQMHCLRSLRVALQDAREGKEIALDWRSNHHWPHCFDYLRSTILCWADDTYEVQAIVNGTRLAVIDGEREIRQCRRPELLYKLVESQNLINHE